MLQASYMYGVRRQSTLKKLRLANAGTELGLLSKSKVFHRPTKPGWPLPSGTKAASTGLLASGLREIAPTPFRFSFFATPAARQKRSLPR